MDADLSHDPKYLPKLIKAASGGHQAVFASRYVAGGKTVDWQWWRRLISQAGNFLVRRFLGPEVRDYTGGYNLFSTKLLRQILPRLTATGYEIQIELKKQSLEIVGDGAVAEIPITFLNRVKGSSKIPRSAMGKNLAMTFKLWRSGLTLRKILISWLPWLLMLAALGAAFMHIGATFWREIYLYNGDSLTPALIVKGWLGGESLGGYLSGTQLWFFPEGVVALVCYLATLALNLPIQGTLILNSIFNLLAFYWLVKLIVQEVSGRRLITRLAAAIASAGMVGLMLLEQSVGDVTLSLVTPFLFNGNYYGAILVGLLIGFLTLKMIKWAERPGRHRRLSFLAVLIGFLVAITYASDPLFLLFFLVPFGLTALTFYIFKKLRPAVFWRLAIGSGIGLGVGTVICHLLSAHLMDSVGDRTQFFQIDVAKHWAGAFRQSLDSVTGVIEAVILVGLIIAALAVAIKQFDNLMQRKLLTSAAIKRSLILFLFGAAPILLMVCLIISGGYSPRYLIAAAVWPLVVLAVLLGRQTIRRLVAIAVALTGLFLIYSLVNLPNYRQLDRIYEDDSPACLIDYVNQHDENVAGSFFEVRAIELYTTNRAVSFAQLHTFTRDEKVASWPWQTFLSRYDGRPYHLIIVGPLESTRDSIYYNISDADHNIVSKAAAKKQFGQPDRVICDGRAQLYYYEQPFKITLD
jgi:hypothetical protein